MFTGIVATKLLDARKLLSEPESTVAGIVRAIPAGIEANGDVDEITPWNVAGRIDVPAILFWRVWACAWGAGQERRTGFLPGAARGKATRN